MLVLGIESSCDETGLAIVEVDENGAKPRLVGEVLASQVALHERYGGVVPELASREHMRNIPLLFDSLLEKTGVQLSEIDCIGVTAGPGLKGCLLIGVTFAMGLSVARQVPLFPVNHIEGHILSGEMHYPELRPPYLALVVSGGHTEIVLVEGLGCYTCLARTLDDAAGEAFDKSANLLDLPYPGGAVLAGLADAAGGSKRFSLPRIGREIPGFSFSGLKTAVLLLIRKNSDICRTDPTVRGDICWVVQDAIVDALVYKTVREVKARGLPLLVCGGVSANKELRRRLEASCPTVYVPPVQHCVDNGAMIAYLAARYAARGCRPPKLDIYSRWPVEELKAFYGIESGAR
jgi:N6-L-threonylcarbamoyladenine synthase